MLTGKQVRVRVVKTKILPQYIHADNRDWVSVAEQLLFAYRDAPGRTRGEIEDEVANLVGDGPTQLVHQGLAKLLEDRCEFEVAADFPPDKIRDTVFAVSSRVRTETAKAGVPFDRAAVLTEAAAELDLTAAQLDAGLFADLKDEQRVITFDDCTPTQLLHRYNVALAQAVLLRSTGMEVRVWGETPARFRQLFRAVKFHRLIVSIRSTDGNGYLITLDGPLSLFSSTQKYGLQLALFLPTLLHCKAFDLVAKVRWGTQKAEKTFALSATDGLKSHLPDFGVHTPREVKLFEENFRANVAGWVISDDPNPIPVEGTTWVPDFTLTHTPSGKQVFVEVVGFWRKVDVEQHYKRLKRVMAGKFVLVVSEAYRADEGEEFALGAEVYRYKRTPVAAEVAKVAAGVIGERS